MFQRNYWMRCNVLFLWYFVMIIIFCTAIKPFNRLGWLWRWYENNIYLWLCVASRHMIRDLQGRWHLFRCPEETRGDNSNVGGVDDVQHGCQKVLDGLIVTGADHCRCGAWPVTQHNTWSVLDCVLNSSEHTDRASCGYRLKDDCPILLVWWDGSGRRCGTGTSEATIKECIGLVKHQWNENKMTQTRIAYE